MANLILKETRATRSLYLQVTASKVTILIITIVLITYTIEASTCEHQAREICSNTQKQK